VRVAKCGDEGGPLGAGELEDGAGVTCLGVADADGAVGGEGDLDAGFVGLAAT
jgi:hypothetical protein